MDMAFINFVCSRQKFYSIKFHLCCFVYLFLYTEQEKKKKVL